MPTLARPFTHVFAAGNSVSLEQDTQGLIWGYF